MRLLHLLLLLLLPLGSIAALQPASGLPCNYDEVRTIANSATQAHPHGTSSHASQGSDTIVVYPYDDLRTSANPATPSQVPAEHGQMQPTTCSYDGRGLLIVIYVYNAATYLPEWGSFTGPDMLIDVHEENGACNYLFANNNPLKYGDPTGLDLYAFDGTGNDMTNTDLPETNIGRLFRAYSGAKHYYYGVGSQGKVDTAIGGYTGAGGDKRLEAMYQALVDRYNSGDASGKEIDIIGFSRGAALGRAFANMIAERGIPIKGTSVQYWNGRGRTYYAEKREYPQIRFLGLFDTVASFGNPNDADNGNKIMTIPDNVDRTAHAIAAGEFRFKFGLTSILDGPSESPLGDGHIEKSFPGAHSDVGGGYGDFPEASYIPLEWMRDQGLAQGAPFDIPFDREVEDYLKAPYKPVLHDQTSHPMYFLDSALPSYWKSKLGFPRARRVFWNE